MALTLALSAFRSRLRSRYDAESQTARHPDALLNELANSGFRMLRSFATDCGYGEYLETDGGTFAGASTGSETFEEINYPSGAVSVRGIDYLDSGEWTPLDQVQFGQRRRFSDRGTPEAWWIARAGFVSTTTYTPGKIAVAPIPPAGMLYKIWYLPTWADISTDTHLFLYQDEPWLQWHLYWAIAELCSRDRDDPGREQRALFELNPHSAGSVAALIKSHAPRTGSARPQTMTRGVRYRG